MNRWFALCTLCVIPLMAAFAPTAKQTPVFADAEYGYRIQAPAFPRPNTGEAVNRFIFQAPPESGFAANVNLMIQEQKTTAKEYSDLNQSQFKQMSWKIDSEKQIRVSNCDALLMDYHGEMLGRNLRWRSLAVIAKDRVYLITCTAAADSFQKYEAAFQACLDSFALES